MYRVLYRAFVLGIVLWQASVADAETTVLDNGYRQMYNFQFDQAHETFPSGIGFIQTIRSRLSPMRQPICSLSLNDYTYCNWSFSVTIVISI